MLPVIAEHVTGMTHQLGSPPFCYCHIQVGFVIAVVLVDVVVLDRCMIFNCHRKSLEELPSPHTT